MPTIPRPARRRGALVAAVLISALSLAAVPAAARPGSTSAASASSVVRAGQRVPNPVVTSPPAAGVLFDPQSNVDGLGPANYLQEEYFLSGTARAYKPVGTWGSDGLWSAELSGASAAYRTRMIVRRPADRAAFNGTVVVEWLNVSAGLDTAPDWGFAREELLRKGYAWVGVSAQLNGLTLLKSIQPDRYGTLDHPGDSFSYDIYSQAAQAVASPVGVKPLGDLKAKRLIADGESQSASRMTTYVNAVQPLTKRFDGFMIHSRFAGAASISQAPEPAVPGVSPARIRTDQSVPVMVFESETDVLGHLAARQPDSRHYRLWEVPGTAHVDKYMLGPVGLAALNCTFPVNDGPQHYVFNAALRALTKWIRNGSYVPPKAPRISIDANGAILRDQHGNALGGIRTPQLDVPVKRLLGSGNSPAFCGLAGTSTPFDAATLAALYPTRADYLNAYVHATLDALKRKFVLGDDVVPMFVEALESPVVG